MRRYTVPFLVATVLLASASALIANPSVGAQDATPSSMDMASHPVVGAWRWKNGPGDPIPYTFAIFHDDGTYTEVTNGVGTGIGAWQPTGERTLDLTAFFQDTDPSVEGFAPGTITVWADMTVDPDGTTATALYTAEGILPDGTVVFSASPPTTGTLTRVEVESLAAATGASAAGTPAP
ncbi:MAG: hypothetical protein K0S78_2422 [Thermomicrobiales bacterium]|nr:hypothetical protein [Thermomicrobiales bacterium]MDF3040001.1 hypothetical protein [Thermomicrobiales bacterium]